MIGSLPNAALARREVVNDNAATPVFFTFDGGCGVIMTLRRNVLRTDEEIIEEKNLLVAEEV